MPTTYPARMTLFRPSQPPPDNDDGYHMGWDGLAAGGIEVFEVPGRHHAMFREPHVRTLAEALRACLDRAHAAAPAQSTARV